MARREYFGDGEGYRYPNGYEEYYNYGVLAEIIREVVEGEWDSLYGRHQPLSVRALLAIIRSRGEKCEKHILERMLPDLGFGMAPARLKLYAERMALEV